MATILFAWESGGGVGHLTRMAPIARALAERGHRVTVALKDVPLGSPYFAGVAMACFQAPVRTHKRHNIIRRPATYAQILSNIGFGDADELDGMTSAWRTLYSEIRPDVTVFDYSPIGLLAARGARFSSVLLGDGFGCPPNISPLPVMWPSRLEDPGQILQHEQAVLGNINRCLKHGSQPPLDCVGQLFGDAALSLLTTYRELDPYAAYGGRQYRGTWAENQGQSPSWPQGHGPRVFVFLNPFRELPAVLRSLAEARRPTVVYSARIARGLQEQFESDTLRFESRPLNLCEIRRECDVAILNASHGTTTTLLMGGKPLLLIPLTQEQTLTAERVSQMGAGLKLSPREVRRVDACLRALTQLEQYRRCAEAFAARYVHWDSQQQLQDLAAAIEAQVA